MIHISDRLQSYATNNNIIGAIYFQPEVNYDTYFLTCISQLSCLTFRFSIKRTYALMNKIHRYHLHHWNFGQCLVWHISTSCCLSQNFISTCDAQLLRYLAYVLNLSRGWRWTNDWNISCVVVLFCRYCQCRCSSHASPCPARIIFKRNYGPSRISTKL